jgi:hypothetical protein
MPISRLAKSEALTRLPFATKTLAPPPRVLPGGERGRSIPMWGRGTVYDDERVGAKELVTAVQLASGHAGGLKLGESALENFVLAHCVASGGVPAWMSQRSYGVRRSLTPGMSPLVNSTPADSSAALIEERVFTDVDGTPFAASRRCTVGNDTPAFSASSRADHRTSARAALI